MLEEAPRGASLDGGEGGFTLLGIGDGVMPVDLPEASLLIGDNDTSSLAVMTTGRTSCRVESRLTSAAPELSDETWIDVVEISVSQGPVVLTGLAEFEALLTVVPGEGAYRLRISRRSVSDGDELLFEAWPAPVTPAVVLRHHVPERDRLELLLETDQAQHVWATTRAIGEMVDRGREALTGELTDMTIVGEVHAQGPHALRKFVQSGGGWDGGYMARGAAQYIVGNVNEAYWSGSAEGKGDGLGGRAVIRQVILELNRTKAARKSWNWVFRPSQPENSLLAADSVVGIEILKETATDAGPVTRLRITHSGIPVEFAAGLELYWDWQFRLFNIRGL